MTRLEFLKSLWQKNRCSLTNYNKISMSIFSKPEILLVSTHLELNIKHLTNLAWKLTEEDVKVFLLLNVQTDVWQMYVKLHQEEILSNSINWIVGMEYHICLILILSLTIFVHRSNHLRIANCRRWLLCCYFRKFNKYLI